MSERKVHRTIDFWEDFFVDDAVTDHPRMVALYDEFNAGTWDTDFYASAIGVEPLRIADIGCGTGSFAVRLAGAGHDVTGVDPSTEMLNFARSRHRAELVRWIAGYATDLPDEPFDAAVMSGRIPAPAHR